MVPSVEVVTGCDFKFKYFVNCMQIFCFLSKNLREIENSSILSTFDSYLLLVISM